MAADALEVRIAHLEGAYEQVDKRLGAIEAGLRDLRSEVRSEFQEMGRKIDNTFRWVIGVILVNWITVMLAIFLRR